MTTPSQNWMIRIASWLVVGVALVGLFFHEYLAREILGGDSLGKRIAVLAILGAVVTICLGFSKEAGKRLKPT